MGNNQDRLVGKLILKAKLTNVSPLLIASGKADEIDFEVIKDSSGKPFIPGAGFAGMLRDSFNDFDKPDSNLIKQIKYFWGNDDNKDVNTSQSHIIIDDLKIKSDFNIVERDGVAIDHITNLGVEGSKFDYEIIEPGASFYLNAEITLREGFEKNTFLEFLYFITQKGKKKEYQQGAFKSSGFGILEWEDIKIYQFDYPDKETKWFDYIEGTYNPENIYKNNNCSIKCTEKNFLSIEGKFSIKNSLIISSGGDETTSDEKAPDKTHLKNSKKDPMITGKTIKGAIRHRALKILNTIGNSNSDGLVDELFGYVLEKPQSGAKQSRIKSFETIIEGAESTQSQPRIKIDRFTGGTVEHALLQSQPLWHKDESFILKFEIENCKDYEAGLMLLVMKDLMCEDLPVGGEKAIGRGVLTGISMNVTGKIINERIEDINLKFGNKGILDKTKIEIINCWINKIKSAL